MPAVHWHVYCPLGYKISFKVKIAIINSVVSLQSLSVETLSRQELHAADEVKSDEMHVLRRDTRALTVPTSTCTKSTLVSVSLFLVGHWPLTLEGKGSRSRFSIVVNITERTSMSHFRETALLLKQ